MRLEVLRAPALLAACRLRPALLTAAAGGAVLLPLVHALLSALACGRDDGTAAAPGVCGRLVVQNVALQLVAGLVLWRLQGELPPPPPADAPPPLPQWVRGCSDRW